MNLHTATNETMRKTILHNSSTISSSSSEDTASTHTQCVSPPIRNSNSFNNLTNVNHLAASNASNQVHLLNTQSSFRKCQSFIHLTKATEKLQTSLIDTEHCGDCDRLRKTTSNSTAIYMAIKQEHHLLVHRIFNRCKVIFNLCVMLCLWQL